MREMFVCSVAAVLVGWAATAQADSPRLRGEYGFTGTAACLHAPGGFNGNLQAIAVGPPPNPSQAYSHSFSVEGIRKFNGNGTGTVNATMVSILPPPTPTGVPPSASSATFSFSFTYTVSADGTLTTALAPGSFAGMFVAGPRNGQTFTIDTLPLTGLVSNDGKSLILASVVPTVETVTYANGDTEKRICHRSRVFIKLDNDGDRDRGRD